MIPDRCSQILDAVLSSWDMASIGMVSRTPKTQTKTGRANTLPANPATPAMVKPAAVATTTAAILINASNFLMQKKAPVHRDGPGLNC